MIESSSYLQSLNEIYVRFSPLGITSIHFKWVENKNVAECLIKIWKNVKQLYTFWNKLPKSKRPSSKSYNGVNEAVDGPFVIANLHFFAFISSLVEPFLTKYKTEKPVLPPLILKPLEFVVKPTVLEHCKGGQKLMDIDLYDNRKLISVGKINLGFAVTYTINILRKVNILNVVQKQEFMKGI